MAELKTGDLVLAKVERAGSGLATVEVGGVEVVVNSDELERVVPTADHDISSGPSKRLYREA